MSRPRAMTSAYCLACRAPGVANAIHRMEHRRLDRRRAQYRASAKRRRDLASNPPYGFLHSLGCSGQHRSKRYGCKPIPVYRRQTEAA